MRFAKFIVWTLGLCGATASDRLPFWRDPGPIESLDLAAGPGGAGNEPLAPFSFVREESRGIMPKVVVTDARGRKWMVKFGEEVKAETFASRISWAAGYPVRASYYVASGHMDGASRLARARKFIDENGNFKDARFQMFDTGSFHEVPGEKLDLSVRPDDPLQLNGLKLTLLWVANWDVKPDNTGILEIDGRRYLAVTDWGASMGDPASAIPAGRKWNCAEYDKRTSDLVDGVDGDFVMFSYSQYLGRHETALTSGIRTEDMKWFVDRMSRLSDDQLRAALVASGADQAETECFTRALRRRLAAFAAGVRPQAPDANRTRTVIETTTTTTVVK